MSGGNQLRVAEFRVTSVTVIPFGAAGGSGIARIIICFLYENVFERLYSKEIGTLSEWEHRTVNIVLLWNYSHKHESRIGVAVAIGQCICTNANKYQRKNIVKA